MAGVPTGFGDNDDGMLSAGFTINSGNALSELAAMDRALDQTVGTAMGGMAKAEAAIGRGFAMQGPIAEVNGLGMAVTREMRSVARETNAAEKAAEAMERQLNRQVSTFGKSASEIRRMNVELKATAAESRGLTDVATKLRAVSAQMDRLEASGTGASRGVKKTGGAMAAMAPQAQDLFTQISMGGNIINAFAVQAGQAAGQMTHMGGVAGKVGTFMMGPWGIALTGSALVVGALGGKLFDGAKAAEAKEKAAKDLTTAIDAMSDSTRSAIATEWEQQRATLASAGALRQKAMDARAATVEEIGHSRAKLASALATQQVGGGTVPGAAGFGMEVAARRQLDALDKQMATRQRELAKTEVTFRNAQIGYMGSAIGARMDQATGVTREYEKVLARLNGQFQRTGDVAAYTAARARLERQYKSETAALDKSDKAHSASSRSRSAAQAKEIREARAAQKEYADLMSYVGNFGEATEQQFTKIIGFNKTVQDNQSRRFREVMGTDEVDTMNRDLAKYTEGLGQHLTEARDELGGLASAFEAIDDVTLRMGDNMAEAFGRVGGAIGGALSSVTGFYAGQARLADQHRQALIEAAGDETRTDRENLAFKLRSGQMQTDTIRGIVGASKGLFSEHSRGYKAMEAAEKAMTAVQLVRTAVDVAGGAARMFSTLGPLGFPAVAAMLGVMASLGFAGGGSGGSLPKANTGSGTTLGDAEKGSESLTRGIAGLREVNTLTANYSREMASSLRSIEGQIGGLASVLVRSGNINADMTVNEGFKTNAIGSVLKAAVPLFGGALASLFGTKTNVTASGLYGNAQTVGSIVGGGFAAQTYSDVENTKKFLGITTGKSTSTVYGGGVDAEVSGQFAMIIKGFNDAIVSAAGPLGASTDAIAAKVSGFVFTLGKIDLKGLTGEQIQEKLTAVFGAAADQMTGAAFPGYQRFQKVGEGMFETLVRVASTVEAVTASFDMLGLAARGLDVDAKVGLAGQFESVGAMTSAADAYFEGYYTKAEQTAAKTAQITQALASMGLTLPATLSGFRGMVEAQDLTSAAGQRTYATLLQLAPAFADLQAAMAGAKSAADILTERQDLERKMLELQGNTAAIRALDLAKVDVSNRALQEQVWAMQDGIEAAKAADELRQAWQGVGDTIMDEVKRIRGLTSGTGDMGFAALQGQFNATIAGARGGDMDMAKLLPGISQSLLAAAEQNATSRQELDRVRAQTAAALEGVSAIIATGNPLTIGGTIAAAQAAAQANTSTAPAAETDLRAAITDLQAELAGMRRETASGLASVAGSTARTAKKLDDVTSASGGDAIAITQAAA